MQGNGDSLLRLGSHFGEWAIQPAIQPASAPDVTPRLVIYGLTGGAFDNVDAA